MFFLDRFIKDISNLPYLYEGEEFKTFLRPPGDLEKAFNNLPKQTTDDLLKKYREKIPILEESNEAKIKHTTMQINEFVKEIRELVGILKNFKKNLKMIVPIKE